MNQRVAIAKGLRYLQQTQATDGHFDTFYSASKQPFRPSTAYRTTFLPALILQALAAIDGAHDLRSALSQWLSLQHGPEWSYNYWATDAPERATMAYPDDLDDTFCAVAGLYLHDPTLIGPDALGKIVRLLLATESKVGGPYRTWLMPRSAAQSWLDVDIAVNANVAYFLRLAARPLPNLTRLMERAIARQAYSSPYYPSAFPIMYYLARAYRGGKQHVLAAQILAMRKPGGHWSSPMQTALMLSALHELGDATTQDKAVSYILRCQAADGSWPAEPFWLEVKNTYSGSAELSTALALEALQKYLPGPEPLSSPEADHRGETLCAQIISEIARTTESLPAALRTQARPTFKHMIRGDYNREIMLLPHFFERSLRTPGGADLELLRRLGLANLYGWTAYTIYDDLLDASGDMRLLPLANAALRLSLDAFRQALPRSDAFQACVADSFLKIDAANAWEVTHCRFGVYDGKVTVGTLPNYGALGKLAERSLGHALTPLGVLAAQHIPPDDPRARLLLRALKHYLIARQLGDDMRDWEIDLRGGQCSYVVAQLLAAADVQPGVHDLQTLVSRLRAGVWSTTFTKIGQQVLQHAAIARRHLARSGLITSVSPVGGLLDDLEAATRRTMAEHADAQLFFKAYQA